jgi:hypothetical protein
MLDPRHDERGNRRQNKQDGLGDTQSQRRQPRKVHAGARLSTAPGQSHDHRYRNPDGRNLGRNEQQKQQHPPACPNAVRPPENRIRRARLGYCNRGAGILTLRQIRISHAL